MSFVWRIRGARDRSISGFISGSIIDHFGSTSGYISGSDRKLHASGALFYQTAQSRPPKMADVTLNLAIWSLPAHLRAPGFEFHTINKLITPFLDLPANRHIICPPFPCKVTETGDHLGDLLQSPQILFTNY
jgi:hypothetical protein